MEELLKEIEAKKEKPEVIEITSPTPDEPLGVSKGSIVPLRTGKQEFSKVSLSLLDRYRYC